MKSFRLGLQKLLKGHPDADGYIMSMVGAIGIFFGVILVFGAVALASMLTLSEGMTVALIFATVGSLIATGMIWAPISIVTGTAIHNWIENEHSKDL